MPLRLLRSINYISSSLVRFTIHINMMKFVLVLLIGAMVAEASIVKRAAASAHMQKMKRGSDRVGMQPGDTDLCPYMDMLGADGDTCDEGTASGKYCILTAWKCDGEQDCHDNSDEKGCKKKGRKNKN